MFHVGQLVVCVDVRPPEEAGLPTPPGGWADVGLDGLARGQVYAVRGVGVHRRTTIPQVWVEEIRRPVRPADWGVEPGFAAVRFRPLKDSALDVFRAALEPAPKQTEPA